MTTGKQRGVNRLSILVGSVCTVLWLLWFALYALMAGDWFTPYYIGGAVLAFAVPFLLIQGVGLEGIQ